MPIPPPLDPPIRLLAPRAVRRRALRAGRDAPPDAGPPGPAFHAVLDEVIALLRAVGGRPTATCWRCRRRARRRWRPASRTCSSRDTAIVAEAGFFGAGSYIAARHGANVVRLEVPWGETVPNAAILDALERHPAARLVAVVHAETSTGALHPLR